MSGAGALQVLVVDDDAADAMMIEEALSAADVPPIVWWVADGVEALEFLRREGRHPDALRPDLVLLDLNMPRMGGREALALIKADTSLSSIPVVVLTTSSADEDVVASYQHRANAYVVKPIDLDAFELAVREIDSFYREVAVLPR